MFDITKLAIEKKKITFTIMFLIVVLGLQGYSRLPKAEDPGFTVRKARIITYFPGASPDRVEKLITDKLEKAVQEMPELEYVKSESRVGFSMITVKMWDRYKDMRPLWDTLRRKVNKVSYVLPQGVVGPFVNDEYGDVFGTFIAVTGDAYSFRELKNVAEEVRDELLYIDEVAKVDIYGAQDERIFIEYKDSKIAELGISSLFIKKYLEGRNIVTPGGAVATEKERIIVEPSGNFESLEDLKNTVVNIPGGKEVVYLKDIATVYRSYIDPPKNIMKFNGKASLALALSLRDGGDISKLGDEVKALIEKIKYRYPIGINFEFIVLESDEVSNRVGTFVNNLFQSVVIVMVIMFVSLGFRTGMVVASLIPMTILLTFFIMSAFNIGIDQTSLASLIIALGMLVDNAIVVSELIFTEVSKGKKPKQAAIEAANEVRTSLFTSSLTTSIAFLPIFLAKSMAGEYTASIFKVVTIALLSSWVLSLTMIPMVCVLFLKVKNMKRTTDKGIYRWYRKELYNRLKRPWKQLGIFGAIFFVAMSGFHFVPKAFFPPSERGLFTIKYEFPVGTKIEHTAEVIRQVEAFLDDQLVASRDTRDEGILNWTTFIGGVTPRYVLNKSPIQLSQEEAFMLFNTTSADTIPELMHAIEGYVLSRFPEVRVISEHTKYGPPVAAPVAVRVSGSDQDKIFAFVEEIKEKLKTVNGTKNIRDDWGANTKKIIALVDQPRALRAGVTSSDVAISLQTMLSGFDTTQYREEDDVIPITLRAESSDRENLDYLETINVYSQHTNISVPLKQVADLQLQWEPSNIRRRNRHRTVTVMADIEEGYNPQKLANSLQPWLEEQKKSWGNGYFYEFGGEKETSENSSKSIIEQIPLAGLIILLLLVSQFNSFRQALIIIMTIPMGIIGVVIGLLLTGTSMGFMTFLGIVSLSGIVINDAIVLIERINLERKRGLSSQEAILEASQTRMRPILLTTYTTVGGMLPLWLGGGALFKPMAIAIIFGLIFATLLTLLFVPVLYTLLYRISFQDYFSKKDAEISVRE